MFVVIFEKKNQPLLKSNSDDVFQKELNKGEEQNAKSEYVLKKSRQKIQEIFGGLKLADMECFVSDRERHRCPICHKNRKFYCADCLIASMFPEKVPKLSLPFRTTIIHHKSEEIKKSSALPVKIYDREHVRILHFPDENLEDVFSTNGTYILYPHKDALTLDKLQRDELENIKNIVVLDSTWSQTQELVRAVSKFSSKYLKVDDYETTFWRTHRHDKKCLSTCEALYYFFKEYDTAQNRFKNEKYEYDGKYDNLLFYYILQSKAIERARLEVE